MQPKQNTTKAKKETEGKRTEEKEKKEEKENETKPNMRSQSAGRVPRKQRCCSPVRPVI